jgi:hypothetical protein
MLKACRYHRTTVTLLAVLVLLAFAAAIASAAVLRARVAQAAQLIPGVPDKAIPLPPERAAKIKQNKQAADLLLLRQQYVMRNNIPFIRSGQQEFELIPLEQMEYTPTAAQVTAAAQLRPELKLYQKYIMQLDPGSITLIPTVVDHRANQTPVKDQNNRGTCVCFASMAGLEAKYGNTSLDLSEQYANYLYMTAEGHGCKSAGLQTTNSADYLKANGVCQESVCPYQNDKYNFPSYCNNGGSPAPAMRTSAAGHDPYRIKTFQKIWRNEALTTDTGTWINNPRYLESILRTGQDIVFGTHVAGWVSPYGGIIDVTLGPGGEPLGSVGGHAMLIVGYDRNQEYFIVKNSWGTARGHAGYVYLTYDYIRTYSKYGYIITEVEPLMMTMIRPTLRAIPRTLPSD